MAGMVVSSLLSFFFAVRDLDVNQLPCVGELGSNLYTGVSLARAASLGELQEVSWPSRITFARESTELYLGTGCKKLEGCFPHRLVHQHGLDQGCCSAISFSKKHGMKGALHDHEALGMSCKVWTNLDMRMAWETCLLLPGQSRLVVPHYGRVGHTTAGYRRWWDNFNAEYWDVAHPWQAVSGSRCDDRARSLDHYLTNWQELVEPCSLSGDEKEVKLLSLKRRTRGADPSREEGLALAPPARIEGESRSGSSGQASHASRAPAFVNPKNAPPKDREDREGERKRKTGRESSPVPSSLERGSRSNKEDLPSTGVSSVPSHARWARPGAHRASNSPPTALLSTPAVVLRSADNWPEW
ncbi:hypothetical protein AMTR_s00047p00225800 [Amborella trichopoda]|uniref:Aminotransferase-like plant mobile domain-containing protein n=1 Tax=Amborella trichopoda TaxID=13333 RepID=U5CX39_AMBTC|nr:hypothetical protein AMTR_s00047p00225800 [Amborella trichopoda]